MKPQFTSLSLVSSFASLHAFSWPKPSGLRAPSSALRRPCSILPPPFSLPAAPLRVPSWFKSPSQPGPGQAPATFGVFRGFAPLLRFLLLTLIFTLTLPSLPAQVTIQNTTYPSGQNVVVSNSTITANTNVTVASGAVVRYQATTSITLGPGFTASSGSAFRAFIFVDADSDGMDDAWEAAYGVGDPNGNGDGDTLTNLQEYLLGTHPTVNNAADSGNTNALQVHRPIQ